jgi:hypothetical protein
MAGRSGEASGSISVVASETSGVLRTHEPRLDIRLPGNEVPAPRFAAEEPDGQ